MKGLTKKEVLINREKYGSNEFDKKKNNSFLKLLWESLSDPIIKILLIALAIKLLFLFKDTNYYETIGILIAIFLASFISSISEYGSNKAFEKLEKENKILDVKVYRDGILENVKVNDIVVGDIVKVSSGDKMPADGILINGSIEVDESFMTGESVEILKKINDVVYGYSVIYHGSGLIRITSVGKNTFIGKITSSLNIKNEISPLRKRLTVLAKSISNLGYIGAICASIAYLFMKIVIDNHYDLNLILNTVTNYKLIISYLIYTLTLSVTIIIMAVPEGLPMMITLVLSSNMKKMLKDNVLVRKLVGIETSGSLNILLCDKTGTLTTGKLKVEKLVSYEGITFDNKDKLKIYPKYENIIDKSLYYNNEAEYINNNIIGGNATDRAIKLFIKNINDNLKVINKKEFSSETKYSMVKLNDGNIYKKGAPNILNDKCYKYLALDGTLKVIDKTYLNNLVDRYTSLGYRVISNIYEHDNEVIFINLIILLDNLRKETKDTVDLISNAGIKVVMITGDDKKTASFIAKKCDILKDGDLVLTHDELLKLDDNKLSEISSKISVIARALPEDKKRLVNIYKNNNLVVGMTGDGVNDAPALKQSDVAFSLGSGTSVAKEASDIILLDDNIKSIYNAIIYGRTIFKSIRKFVIYQLTVNICALCLSIIGPLINIQTPITIVQMLWLNMIMDTFAGLAFSYEPPLKKYMEEKPKSKNEKIINKYMINEIVVNGLYSFLLCILFLKLPLTSKIFNSDKSFYTAFFALFIFLGICNSFLARTHEYNLFNNILKNKIFIFINVFIFIVQIYIIYHGKDMFRTYGLSIRELIIIILISFSSIIIDIIRKIIYQKSNKNIGV